MRQENEEHAISEHPQRVYFVLHDYQHTGTLWHREEFFRQHNSCNCDTVFFLPATPCFILYQLPIQSSDDARECRKSVYLRAHLLCPSYWTVHTLHTM